MSLRKSANVLPHARHSRGPSDLDLTSDTERFRIFVGSVGEYAMFTLDTNGLVVDWNDGAERIKGYAANEIVGRHFSVFYTPEDRQRDAPAKLLEKATRQGRAATEGWRLRKDGTRFFAHVDLHAIRDTAGRLIGFGEMTRDVSDQQDAAKLREDARLLSEARERAELASRAKTEFLAMMSHEIRTPLTGIKGYAELLSESPSLSPKERRYTELIQTSCSVLLTIINDVLDFSKIEAGHIELRRRPFFVAALLDNVLSIGSGIAGRKGLELDLAIAPDVPPVLVGDEDRLRQVLLNLLNNAIKFTERGRVAVTVTRERCSASSETITFSVADTGIGLTEDQLKIVFDRFTQANRSISQRYGGTGLGLSISQRLVELMEGRISAVSRHGEGSTFSFSVPLPRSLGPAEGGDDHRPNGGEPEPARLLVVEDVPTNQEIARVFLENAGYSLKMVSSGTQALTAFQQESFDAVLMDVRMPDMDGLEATRRIRAMGGEATRTPIIALTANVMDEDIEECRRAGMNDHIAKPFDRRAMCATIERWTKSRGLAKAS